MNRDNFGLFIKITNITLGFMQAGGLILIFLKLSPVLIALSGLAAVVRYFLPIPVNKTIMGALSALAGLGVMIIYSILIIYPIKA